MYAFPSFEKIVAKKLTNSVDCTHFFKFGITIGDQRSNVSLIGWSRLEITSCILCPIGGNTASTSTMKNYDLLISLLGQKLNKERWVLTSFGRAYAPSRIGWVILFIGKGFYNPPPPIQCMWEGSSQGLLVNSTGNSLQDILFGFVQVLIGGAG